MKNTFESYMKEPYVLDFCEMQRLHGELLSEIGNDPDAIELYDELIDIATRYASIRAKWGMLSREEKMDTDSLRTSHHNSVIIHFNMLARYLRMQGKKQRGGISLEMMKRTDIIERQSVILDAISFL